MRGDMDQPVAQTESPLETGRRIENVVTVGVVEEVAGGSPGRCRVRIGDNITDWLPWLTLRAASRKGSFWWPPSPGEQVVVLSPGGDLARGCVLLALFSDAMPQDSEDLGGMLMQWAESDYMRYGGNVFVVQLLETVLKLTPDYIEMTAGGATMRLDADGLTVSPEVQVGAIKLSKHKHAGVVTGPMVSAGPVP